MPILLFLLGFVLVVPAISCPPNSLNVVEPQTQKPDCLERWALKTIVMVTEQECVPCAELLERIHQEQKAKKNEWKVVLVWVGSDLPSCLSSALKMSSFAQSWCASRQELTGKWKVDSTPVVFWQNGEKKEIQRGNFPKQVALPWNAPE